MPLPDNEQVSVEFVIAVEQFPVLYNYNLKEYSNRLEQDKAWRIVAERFNATENECRLRWRNIRNALTRFLRTKSTTGSGAKKPYYLLDHLQYLLPYTKTRVQSGNIGISQSPRNEVLEDDVEEFVDEEVQDKTDETVVEDVGIIQTNSATITTTTTTTSPTTPTNISASSSSWSSSRVQKRKVDPLEKVVTSYLEPKSTEQKDSAPNPDLNFLTSLLPDVQVLTPKKKIIFKRKVLEILEELSEDDYFSPGSASSTLTHSSTPTPQ